MALSLLRWAMKTEELRNLAKRMECVQLAAAFTCTRLPAANAYARGI